MADYLHSDEWRVLVAAWAYESGQDPIMSDNEFDGSTLILEQTGTSIPGFSPKTGMWVKALSQRVHAKCDEVLEYLYEHKYIVCTSETNYQPFVHWDDFEEALSQCGVSYEPREQPCYE